jgi:hypothetical protein
MLTRRTFLQLTVLTVPSLALSGGGNAVPPIRVALIGGDVSESLKRGVQFGAREAEVTAGLMRRQFVLSTIAVTGAPDVLREHEGAVIAAGIGAEASRELGKLQVPLLLIHGRREPEPEGEHFWRLDPSAEMYAAAVARVRERLSADELAEARAVAWHPALARYGAGELNERFEEQTGEKMDEDAWLGWLATKIALESALRRREFSQTRIDGHKGVALRFDGRQLQQPLYVVLMRDGKEVVIDA